MYIPPPVHLKGKPKSHGTVFYVCLLTARISSNWKYILYNQKKHLFLARVPGVEWNAFRLVCVHSFFIMKSYRHPRYTSSCYFYQLVCVDITQYLSCHLLTRYALSIFIQAERNIPSREEPCGKNTHAYIIAILIIISIIFSTFIHFPFYHFLFFFNVVYLILRCACCQQN